MPAETYILFRIMDPMKADFMIMSTRTTGSAAASKTNRVSVRVSPVALARYKNNCALTNFKQLLVQY